MVNLQWVFIHTVHVDSNFILMRCGRTELFKRWWYNIDGSMEMQIKNKAVVFNNDGSILIQDEKKKLDNYEVLNDSSRIIDVGDKAYLVRRGVYLESPDEKVPFQIFWDGKSRVIEAFFRAKSSNDPYYFRLFDSDFQPISLGGEWEFKDVDKEDYGCQVEYHNGEVSALLNNGKVLSYDKYRITKDGGKRFKSINTVGKYIVAELVPNYKNGWRKIFVAYDTCGNLVYINGECEFTRVESKENKAIFYAEMPLN